ESQRAVLHRDSGSYRRHRQLEIQRRSRAASRRLRAALPVTAGWGPAEPDVDDLVRRHTAGGAEQELEGPRAESPRGSGGAGITWRRLQSALNSNVATTGA